MPMEYKSIKAAVMGFEGERTVLIGGSGTSAVETMLAVIPRDGTSSLVIANGVYGERMARSPREAYRGYQEKLENYNCAFAAMLHNATTPAQRQAAAAKFKGWENDLRILAGSPD